MQGLNREEPDQTGCTHEYWQRRKQVCVVVGGREWGLWGRGKGELEGEGRGGEGRREGRGKLGLYAKTDAKLWRGKPCPSTARGTAADLVVDNPAAKWSSYAPFL